MAKKNPNRAKDGIKVVVVPPYQPPKPGPGGVLYVTDDGRLIYDTPRQVLRNHSDDDGVLVHIYAYRETVRLVEEEAAEAARGGNA